jgi:phospholipase/lecithinase/hemolysin
VKLDVYRSCSRQEKRQVLDAFWRTNVHPTNRIHDAAAQYGPYAVLSLLAVAAELLVVILVSIDRALVISVIAILLEAFVLWSLWWAITRSRAIRHELPSSA